MAVWLAVAYPLSVGPALYAVARGWLSSEAMTAYSRPAALAIQAGPDGVQRAWEAYGYWWLGVATSG